MADKIEIIKIDGIIDNHTSRRIAPVVPDVGMKDPDDIVEYGVKQKVSKIGEGEDDYKIEEVVVEISRVNRKAFIEKDADQVGVLNVLEKVRRSGDISLLNQIGATIPEGIQDYTNVPSNIGEALAALEKGSSSFEGLKAIFGDTSFDALAKMSPNEISEYLNKYVQSHNSKIDDKKGEE